MNWLTPAVFVVIACMAVYTIVRAVQDYRRHQKALREMERWLDEYSKHNKGDYV